MEGADVCTTNPCHQFFQVVIQRAGTHFVFATGLSRDFLHDSVAMAVFVRKREQDVLRASDNGRKGSGSVFIVGY